jgi:hypothetical protein
MHHEIAIGCSSNAFFGTSAALRWMVSPLRPPPTSSSPHTLTSTGLVVQKHSVPPRASASILVTVSCPGLPNARPLSLILAPKLSTGPWPTPWQNAAGFHSWLGSFSVSSTRLLLSSVAMFRRSAYRRIQFIIDGLSISSWISTSYERRLLLVSFMSCMFLLPHSLQTS